MELALYMLTFVGLLALLFWFARRGRHALLGAVSAPPLRSWQPVEGETASALRCAATIHVVQGKGGDRRVVLEMTNRRAGSVRMIPLRLQAGEAAVLAGQLSEAIALANEGRTSV